MRKLLVLLAILLLCTAPARAEITAAAQLNDPGITVGVDQGSAAERIVRELLPQAKVAYFTDKFMGYTAVAQGKIDAFAFDRVQMQLSIANGQAGVHLLEENLGEPVRVAVGLSPASRIPDLENQVNRFIAELRADGTLDDMYRRWVVDGNGAMPEIAVPGAAELHLTVGTSGIVPPYSYYEDGRLTGYDIELAYRFAAWLGADVQFKVYDYGAIIPAALTGDVDCVMANLNITPERAEALAFSDVLFESAVGIMVRGEAAAPAWAAYNGKRIGVLTGPLMEDIAHANFPDSEYLLFNSYPDLSTALLAGRIDAYLGDEPGLKSVHAEQPRIDYIRERITNQEYSFAFRKDDPASAELCAELNAFLALCHQDGTMQELDDIWFGVDEARKVVDMSGLTGENGTIRVVTTSTDMPWSYIKDGRNVGYDIDLVVRFCRWAGYRLELGDVDFAARIPAIQSGKYDFTTDMNVTEERKEQVLFSDPTSSGGVVLAVLADPDGGLSARFAGKTIGVQTGTIFDAMVAEQLPEAQVAYYNGKADLVAALGGGKVAAFAADEPVAQLLAKEDARLTWLPEYLDEFEFAFVFPRSEAGGALRDQFNSFLANLPEGTLEALAIKWFGEDESRKTMPELTGLTAENGALRVATESGYAPFEYVRDGEVVGYDMELAALFCEACGYGLEIVDMNFDAILPAVQTGECDFAASGISVTPERAESVLFSEPYYAGSTVLVVMKSEAPAAGAQAKGGFWDAVADSFRKTFLRENRWQLFLEGIGTTLLITLLSILFGTALGFLVFMLCRNGNAAANGIARFCVWLVTGTPMVVLLMILHYILFASVAISGIAVAVIGFTLTFGASVFGLLRMGVGTIDRGQYEAAYALGHSNRHTFFRIILPQAIPHVLPAYQGEIVGLIKATAIVGYIAVQDLTKMGDIVRSRTYDAFFPLIAITVIYFILEGLFSFAVGRIRIGIDPRKRSREKILKGVKLHD